MLAAERASALLPPPAPSTVEETGLSLDLIAQLTLKQLHFAGQLSGTELATRLGLSFSVVEPAIQSLKAQQQCEITGGSLLGGATYRYRITDAGRNRAALFLKSNLYLGVAPVPIQQYQRYLERFQGSAPRTVTAQQVEAGFSHMVINDRTLNQLGPAINTGSALFLYGAPGNGKTTIAQAIRNLLPGEIAVPHALEIEGSIVRLYDPVNHEAIASEGTSTLDAPQEHDMRWVRCRRPMVIVGGELTLESLELSFNPIAGFYRAPVQAVANGGLLVIDDFGRQRCSPQELLNRWIVPLESRVDFLTLQTGQKFVLPFLAFVVFATNLKPAQLMDEAFLRRIPYKIFTESPTPEEFIRIFEGQCERDRIRFDASLVEDLLRMFFQPRGIPLRGCHPRDLIRQALTLAAYRCRPRELTADLLQAACASYFVVDGDGGSTA